MQTNTRLALQLLAGFLFLAAVWFIRELFWPFGHTSVRGPMTVSLSNAKQLATGCRLYALDHDGRFPVHLEELSPDYITDIKSVRGLVGESADAPLYTYDWLYFGAGFTDEKPPALLIGSPHITAAAGKQKKRIIMKGDASGGIIPEEEYVTMLTATVRQMRELDDRQHSVKSKPVESPAK